MSNKEIINLVQPVGIYILLSDNDVCQVILRVGSDFIGTASVNFFPTSMRIMCLICNKKKACEALGHMLPFTRIIQILIILK